MMTVSTGHSESKCMEACAKGHAGMTLVAVIVTYQPDLKKLAELLDALIPQVDSCVLVDNGSSIDIGRLLDGRCCSSVEFIALQGNLGIATAQNIGIARAKERNADYVLLSDQDSVPHRAMVSRLLTAIEKKQADGAQVACAGPGYLDSRQGNRFPFTHVRGLRLKRHDYPASGDVVPVDHLIASGCLIPMPVLDRVGRMRDDLFIEYVDIEWGLRARQLGYQSYGVFSAGMEHSLGEQPLELFFGKKLTVHSPLRHYYLFRNTVLLYKESWIPVNWKCVHGWRMLVKYVLYFLFATPRMAHWKMMTLGVWHGLLGRSGKYDKE